ncbi:MAG: DUF4124 domain-containing protein [Gammaproteobacteria bacterium]|nr:DUF4124 domain-containing protein [Gammaproteobacteria bacterium]NIM75050.1 DUF4124 domain-containing protein [Gammaproteobacteria bacterium]NIN40100.1 DUF4124 domain-containing protein [Gammaproteobacteria bacterium]NIO26587.1 DUF4124 domain-containing protein [Gammaproteobacteria bacterium]NIO67139.1 DUF4124 domain-containing protein [Gammaproteobacteria bacterium]
MRRIELLATMALTLALTTAGAEVYKWVDADGKVHYGDRKPASGGAANVIELQPAPAVDADHAARSLQRHRLLEAFEAERAKRRQADADAAAAKRERDEACTRARRQLAELQRAHIVYTENESGERNYMSDDDRRTAAGGVQAWIDEHCD